MDIESQWRKVSHLLARTWNIQNRSYGTVHFLDSCLGVAGVSCVGLQEAQFMYNSRQSIFSQLGWYPIWSKDNKCTLWYRRAWREHQCKTVRGGRFVIVFFTSVAVISLYLPHSDLCLAEEEENAEFKQALYEVTEALNNFWRMYPARPRATMLLVDAKVEAAQNVTWEGKKITGEGVEEEKDRER
eukprot:4979515-Pyramimonas_sp.AAC.1